MIFKKNMGAASTDETSKRPVRCLALLLSLILAASCSAPLVGCSNNSNDTSQQTASTPTEVTVIDAKEREVVIPDTVDRIAITCNGGTTQEVCIFGGADKIVAQPSMKKFPQLMKMYPQFESVVNAGSFDDLNIEAMVAQEPDLALVGISSEKGNAQIEEVGIPTYTMLIGWADIESLKQEFLNVGQIVNGSTGEAKAQELVDHWNEKLASLETKLSSIPANERKTVYYVSKPDITAANLGDWGRTWIDTAGGVFAVPETDLNGEVTVEKALSWDPDVIVVQGGSDISELLTADNAQDLQAVKNNQVYSIPIGAFWWDRPCPEATLGFLWLAQTLYPDQMADVDLKAETKSFFKEFYEYDLSDTEYESFFDTAK